MKTKKLIAGINVRFPKELREKAQILKEERSINLSAVIRKLFTNYVNEQFKEA